MLAFASAVMDLVFFERVLREREGVDAMGVEDFVVDACVYVVGDETVGVVDVAWCLRANAMQMGDCV